MAEIEELKKTIRVSDDTHAAFEQQLKDYTQKKEELSASHKGFPPGPDSRYVLPPQEKN